MKIDKEPEDKVIVKIKIKLSRYFKVLFIIQKTKLLSKNIFNKITIIR